MNLIFLDESGNSKSWKSDKEQRFYVLAAYIVDAHLYIDSLDGIRAQIAALPPCAKMPPLGQGYEIKGSSIANGSPPWKKDNESRNKVRDLMLNFPSRNDGRICLCVIDKQRHLDKYTEPNPPHELALQFVLERVHSYQSENELTGLCIYDQCKHLDSALHKQSCDLIRDGSRIYNSNKVLNVNSIKEFYLGSSENSLGLQVADFYASFTYHFFKKELPREAFYWKDIRKHIFSLNGKFMGIGLKVWPDINSKDIFNRLIA